MLLINFCKNNLLNNLFGILFFQTIFYDAKTDKVDLFLLKEKNQSSPLLSSSAVSITASINLAKELEKLNVDDYPELVESTKPDNVDNEIIDKIVDHFLNKGTLDDMKTEKSNKEAQALVNSSTYWSEENIQLENSINDPIKAVEWLAGYLLELEKILHRVAVDGWTYFTTASSITRDNLRESEEVARLFLKKSAKQARQFNIKAAFGNNATFVEEKLQMELITKEGINALSDTDLEHNEQISKNINQVFTTTSLCDISGTINTPCIYKFTDLMTVFQNSNDANNTLKWWLSWRLAAGKNLTELYSQLVNISNKAAKLNNYNDIGAMWSSAYNNKEFNLSEEVEMCFKQIEPFYKQLHAYIRPRLAAIFNGSIESMEITRDGAIPIHLLKSLNGENWLSHFEQTKPFTDETVAMSIETSINELTKFAFTKNESKKTPAFDETTIGNIFNSTKLDISEEILANFRVENYTVKTMFTKVYRYMKHLGFETLPSAFWSKSIFSRNWSKDMICNPATAYDMVNIKENDYRIKICSQLSEQEFINAHKLMAQLYYKYLSRNNTILLRDAPNPSLVSAFSSAFGILATNPEYLKALKLLDVSTDYSEPYVINKLYREALDQFVNLPFTIVADKWRYSVFEGKIKPADWSSEWWTLRYEYQGLKAPLVENIETMLNTKAAVDERVANLEQLKDAINYDMVVSPIISQQHAPAIRNFVSYILQFQILKQMCPETNALNQGCIPKKKIFKKMIQTLSMGSTISWTEAMKQLAGKIKLDADALLEYYEPLISWLKNTNQHEKNIIGWKSGKNEPYTKEELPKLKYNDEENEQKQILPNEEQIAYPGQSCANGQECLLDTICNGTICICKEGLFTLKIADSYNCVPGDPAQAGFTDNNGGLVIALNPTENSTETKSPDSKSNNKNVNNTNNENYHQNSNEQNIKTANSVFTSYFAITSNWIIMPSLFILFLSKVLIAQL